MLWLEMSIDEEHGGDSWGFTHCLWAPTRKNGASGGSWPYWESVAKTREGDMVLHLRGRGREAAFVGYSTVDSDGLETSARPANPGQWDHASSFYRAELKEFNEFPDKIPLQDIFQSKGEELRDYFAQNRLKSRREKKRLFFVIQSGRIQCLNGAYLSEVDDDLASILIGNNKVSPTVSRTRTITQISTGQRWGQLWQRVGQKRFSDCVCQNYQNQCCFPKCRISERRFLVGSHIARWADAPHLRGEISNGLCFCLMHDKAFENGLFTLDAAQQIWVNKKTTKGSPWAKKNLLPFHGHAISPPAVSPSFEALKCHWERNNFASFDMV